MKNSLAAKIMEKECKSRVVKKNTKSHEADSETAYDPPRVLSETVDTASVLKDTLCHD